MARLSRETLDSDEGYLYLILCIAAGFAGLAHILLLGFFAVANVLVMVGINIVSILIYALCLFLTFRRHYTITGLLISLEIVTFTAITMLVTGFFTYFIFYYVLVIILQIIIPYGRPWMRVGVCVLIFALLLCQVHIERDYLPPYPLGNYYIVLSSFNIVISLFAVAAELFVSTYVKGFIARLRAKHTAELESLAHSDTLTGLYNRRYAELCFERIREETPPRDWCIAMLDIDFFKTINDTHGHAAGDLALIELAGLLKTTLRSSDLIFRWGGEEFLIVLATRNCEIAARVLENIRRKVESLRTCYDDLCLQFTVTIGVCPLDLERIEESIATCDARLYEGKKNGRNRVVV
jgi:diguanylate cyclase (GGDEF)-like protein